MRRQELHPHTAVINRSQKKQSKNKRLETLQWLALRFPKAFDNTLKIQPLKVGIMKEILTYAEEAQAAGFSNTKLREAVVIYTRRIDYLICIKAKEMRIDLFGNPDRPVSDDEAIKASHKIKKRIEKSLKNSRKTSSQKINTSLHGLPTSMQNTSFSQMHYIEKKPLYSMQEGTFSLRKPPIIKTKVSRAYDPEAVARMKQKLGLKQKKMDEIDG